jgi:hypothetical protein
MVDNLIMGLLKRFMAEALSTSQTYCTTVIDNFEAGFVVQNHI